MITKRIHEGKYIKLSRPVPETEMRCLRCGGAKGHAFREKDGISWFCMNEDCMAQDRDISRKRSRQDRIDDISRVQRYEYKNPRSYGTNKGSYWYQSD